MAMDEAQAGGRRPAQTVVVYPQLKSPRAAVADGGREPEARLDEAVALTRAIGVAVAWAGVVPVARPRPATLIGLGNLDNLKAVVAEKDATLAVFDAHLSPIQQRNLEKALSCKVIDRTALILEIFGERARTREGALQVELAHLSYQRSRLVRSWTHLERQRGGFGFMGGPGETQIEMDRRLIGERIGKLKTELEDVKRTRHLHRAARQRVPFPVVALVGYTNAGKSTLFNRLTRASVFAEDMLFATLDPTMRRVKLPSGREIILSDTVGFISDLPTELVAAFRATLEEVCEADLIVHVRDVSHPDTEVQKADVLSVLGDLGLAEVLPQRLIEAANKVDRLDGDERAWWRQRAGRSSRLAALSAKEGEGVDGLLALIDEVLASRHPETGLDLAHQDGRLLAWLYGKGAVTGRRDDESGIHLTLRLSPLDAARLQAMLKDKDRGDG